MSKGRLIDLEIMRDETYMKGSEIIVWGAGEKGKHVIDMLKEADIPISCICDSNADLWDTEMESYLIKSPFTIRHFVNTENLCAILCVESKHVSAIQKSLDYIVDTNYQFATYFGIVSMFRFHYQSLFRNPSIAYSFAIEKNMGRLEYQKRQFQILNELCQIKDGDVLVLQPGKVGSLSIYSNLRRERRGVYHFHHIHFPMNFLEEGCRGVWERAWRNLRHKRLKIITGVREPISRDFSALFQALNERNNIRRGEWLFNTGDLYEVFRQYENMILHGNYEPWRDGIPEAWGDEFLWFDREIRQFWGIDIYEHPFNKEEGYSIICSDGIEIFLYKCEKLNDILMELYQFALGHPLSHFFSENRMDVSWCSAAYQEFKHNVVPSLSYIEHYYKNNKKMDHFYSLEEKDEFLKAWERKWKGCRKEF